MTSYAASPATATAVGQRPSEQVPRTRTPAPASAPPFPPARVVEHSHCRRSSSTQAPGVIGAPLLQAERCSEGPRVPLLVLPELAQDDGHRGGRHHAKLSDHHGDVLGRHDVVLEVQQPQPRVLAPALQSNAQATLSPPAPLPQPPHPRSRLPRAPLALSGALADHHVRAQGQAAVALTYLERLALVRAAGQRRERLRVAQLVMCD
jgi:hypothetical protein